MTAATFITDHGLPPEFVAVTIDPVGDRWLVRAFISDGGRPPARVTLGAGATVLAALLDAGIGGAR